MKRTHQRFLSLLLALVMVLGLMPMETLASAAEGTEVIDVEVYVDRQQTVTLEGTVIPDASGVEGIAAVTYETANMAAIGSTNAFSEGFEPQEKNLYTFDRQENGTWLIWAEVNGTRLYVDPHAGAGNGGKPSRD